MKIELYPYLEKIEDFPLDGLIIKTPPFCYKANRKKCIKYYSCIHDKIGVHICPYGFSSYVFTQEKYNIIYTGLKIQGNFDRKKVIKHLYDEFSPVIPIKRLEESLQQMYHWRDGIINELNGLEELKKHNIINKDFINITIHEIRRLNTQIKRISEELSKEIELGERANLSLIEYKLKNIFALSSLASVRLDAYDFDRNPNIILSGTTKLTGIYKKFEKVKHCLSSLANEKKVGIKFEGESYFEWDTYKIFDILPFLLIENAIKYSPENQEINIKFVGRNNDILEVQAVSVGPLVYEDELEKVFENHYQGKNAKQVMTSGTGIGLYLAKQICDIHKIEIIVGSGQRLYNLNKVPYSDFTVTLKFIKKRNHF